MDRVAASPDSSGAVPQDVVEPPDSVAQAAWKIPDEDLNRAHDIQEPESPVDALHEDEVIRTVLEAFPLVWAALQEQEIAGGNLTASLGAYDLQAFAFSNSQPLGFYQNHRHAIGFSQLRATDGSRWFSGYRLGDGRFPDWYGERLTNRGGELAVGANIPLRRDRDIDPQRARWFKAEQQTLAAEPYIQQQQNVFVRDATAAYWRWLSAGMRRNVQQRILDLARDRARQIERRVQQGDLPELSLIDNDRLIAQREAAAIDAEQAYQAATIQLSLFLRDPTGRPLQVSDQRRPATFPELVLPELPHSDEEIRRVLQAHPALAVLNLQIQQQQVDVQLARNLVLPRLDLFWETSQDLGAASSASRDKSPFELETGFVADVPLQRREAVGQLAAARARLEQLQWERSFLEDSLMTSLQEQIAAMANARQRFERALANVRLAEQALEIGRRAFLAGDIDLIVLNIYEQSLADAVLLQIDAQRAFFLAAVEYRLALGLPMDRSP